MVAPPVVSVAITADYDADSIGLADGASVASWTPVTGTETLAQSTATAQPVYRTSVGSTGHAGVEFDGGDALFNDNLDGVRPWSALVVFMPDAVSNGYIFASHNNSFTGALRFTSGSLVLEGFGATVTDGTVSTGSPHVAIGRWTASDSMVQLDGAGRSTGAGISRDRFDLKLGNEPSDLNRFGLDGTILRMILFNGSLTDQDMIVLDTWVQDTYGIPVADYSGPPPATGGIVADALKIGTADVDKAYIGTNQVWP